jgi:hypothetical protein
MLCSSSAIRASSAISRGSVGAALAPGGGAARPARAGVRGLRGAAARLGGRRAACASAATVTAAPRRSSGIRSTRVV